jgi:hypothetical protein
MEIIQILPLRHRRQQKIMTTAFKRARHNAALKICLACATTIFTNIGAPSGSLSIEASASPDTAHQRPAHWTTLTPSEFVGETRSLPFFRLQTENGSAAYLVVADVKNGGLKLSPFFNSSTGTTSAAARLHGALVAVNGGYFNLSDSQSASYVTVDGQQRCEPRSNRSLVKNPKLKPYLEKIFNRSELRLLRNSSGATRIDIRHHEDPLPSGWLLVGSLQAGPQLLPELTAQQEAFIRTNPDGTTTDAIGSRRPAARTACGVTADGHVMLLCIASKGQDEFSSGATLEELALILRQLGCDRAINFDGGTSTTMIIKSGVDGTEQPGNLKQVCGRTPEKLVKSGLLITSTQN